MKRLLITLSIGALLIPAVSFAAWDGLPYDPNETLDPECSPTDNDCTVSLGFTVGADGGVSMQSATSTSLVVTGLNTASCDVKADANGRLYCGADQTSTGAANPFTWATNFGQLTAATSSTLWAQNGIFASSTSYFAGANFLTSTTTGRAYFGGSVGIGTTSPSVPLSVVGDAYIVGNLRVTGITTFGAHSWQITQNNDESFVLQSSRGDAGIFIDNTNGRVGIATNAPKAAFHFLDTINSDGDTMFLENEEALSTYFRVGNRNAGYQLGVAHGLAENFVLQRVGAFPSLVVGSTTGYIGIASTSPTYQFSVEGTSSLGNVARAGYFIATSTTASTLPFASTTALSAAALCLSTDCRTSWPTSSAFPFTPTALGNSTSTLLQLLGGVISSASSTIGSGSQDGGLTISGGATTTGNLLVQGTSRFVQDVTVNANLDVLGQLEVNNSATFNEISVFNELTLFTSDVGIGSSTPGARFAVQGNGLFSGDLGIANLTATGTAYIAGNVSIGTTSPVTGLDIGNAITATASGQVAGLNIRSILTGRSNTSDGYYGIKLVPTMIAGGNTQTMTGLYVAPNFNDNGKTGVTHYDAVFNGGGNVVIGASTGWSQSSPAKLAVQGSASGGAVNIDFKNNGFVSLNNEVRLRLQPYSSLTDDNASYISSIVTNAGSGAGDLVLGVSNGGGGTIEAMRMKSNGNIGMGTTSPGTRLSVAGDAVISGRIYGQYFTATSTLTASAFPFASTTALSAAALCFATDCRTSWPTSSSFPFTPTTLGNSTSTLLRLLGGVISHASSTIGNGSQDGGLTISGGATTTGMAYFVSSVGIGTSSPQRKLHIVGTDGAVSSMPTLGQKDFFIIENNGNANMALIGSATGSSEYKFIPSGASTLRGSMKYDYTNDFIGFYTGGNTGLYKMVILANGNVGIGSTTPTYKLSVEGESSLGNIARAGYFVATSTSAASTFPFASTTAISGENATFTGNVGINSTGVTSAKLDVRTSGAGNVAMRLIADSFETAFRLSENSTFSNVDFSAVSGGSLRVDNLGYVVFNNTGNVGLGSTTPYSKLSVQKNYGNTAGSLFTVASSTASDGSTASTLFNINSVGTTYFGGAVGIGTTSPAANLDIFSSGFTTASINSITSHAALAINAASGFDPKIYFQTTAATRWSMGVDSSDSNKFFLGINETLPTSPLFTFTTTGNLGIGTTSPAFRLSVEGSSALGNVARAGYFIATSSTASTFPLASTTLMSVSNTAYFPGSGIWKSDGKVGIGTSSPSAPLSIYFDGGTPGSAGLYISQGSDDNLSEQGARITLQADGMWHMQSNRTDSNFSIRDSDGSHGVYLTQNSGSWNSFSDARLKMHVEELSVLDKIKNFRAVKYEWVVGGKTELGVVAQELQQVFPELVTDGGKMGDLDNLLGVTYDRMGPIALQGVKELDIKLESLATTSDDMLSAEYQDSFAGKFFSNIFARITTWLADAANGIQSLYANTFRAKDQICIGDTCVNEEQLKALLAGQAASPSVSAPEPDPEPEPESASEEAPTPIPEPGTEEVEVTEDPLVEEIIEETASQESQPQSEPVATTE